MARNTRNKTKREADLLVVAEMYLKGRSMREIGL